MQSSYEALSDELERAGLTLVKPLWLQYQDSIKQCEKDIANTEDDKEEKELKSRLKALKTLLLDVYHTKLADTYQHLLFEIGEDSTYWLYDDDDGIYKEMNVSTLRGIVMRMTMRDNITTTIAWVRECLARYRAEYPERGHRYNDFDTDYSMFHAKNGWVCIKTFKLHPHTPERLSRFVSPTVFDPKATCPLYDNTLDNVLPIKKDAVRVIDQFSGYVLTGDIHLGKMLVIQSKPGFAKSTIIEAWLHVLGTGQLGIRKSLNSLASDSERFAGSSMVGKTLCWFDESATKSGELGTKLETLITGTYLPSIERKGINGLVDAENHIKCVLTANKLPQHKEDGVFRRMIFIRFPDNVPSLTDMMQEDPNMIDKMRLEASGILNRMLRGLQDLQKMKKFTVIEGEAEMIEEMKIASDTLTEFLHTYFDPDTAKTEFYSTQELFEAYSYSDFSIGKRFLKTTRSFAYHLRERSPSAYQQTLYPDTDGARRGWRGIVIKKQYEFNDDFGKCVLKEKSRSNQN